MNLSTRPLVLAAMLVCSAAPNILIAAMPTELLDDSLAISAEPIVPLDEGWKDPPQMARTQCWWWWLNGNVTKEAITRDLEEMKAKGMGGPNIVDAGGADQRGHRQVPHGPDFGSPEWRELFVHALAEADRLGLEVGFNIQSGWNLGGPTVTPEQAAKKLTWEETPVLGGELIDVRLPRPRTVADYYRDIAVLAIPLSSARGNDNPLQISADSSLRGFPAELAVDEDQTTYWVSGSDEPGKGPSMERPVVMKLEFAKPVTASELVVDPREDYGPKRGWVQAADSPQNWRVLTRWTAEPDRQTLIKFPRTTARLFRLVIVEAYDPQSPVMPRNVQIAEVELRDGDRVVGPGTTPLARIDNHGQKMYDAYPGPFTAPSAEHLLEVRKPEAKELAIRSAEVVDVTKHVDAEGRLRWQAPTGNWKILRLGYTLAGSRVSTSSEGWQGWAIDYCDPAAFEQYWTDVVQPLMEAAKPYVGQSLKFLHTDSWELGPINWTPALPQQFARLRGYKMSPYLPALAGYVVDDRVTSNRFLNDFRRTLGDLIADGKYATFRRHAHELGLGVHPESGGPHAAPIDSLKCLGRNDITMGEFWARSATHRVRDEERFFTKQPASAAHIYGKRVVLAESFTSIGPQWEEDPRSLKPVFDQAACEGLNLVMVHTYDSSPNEMGEPGQAYFAGTHINRHTTWWNHVDAFFRYLNRCQFMLQQGLPVSDVLYFYGENVPSFVRLKSDDPASVLPGYDYDVTNTEALVERTSVRNGKIVLPEGTTYQLLALPERDSYGVAALEHVAKLVRDGATVVGPKPTRPIGLANGSGDERKFQSLVAELWNEQATDEGRIKSIPTRDALRGVGIRPDFTATNSDGEVPQLDFIHRRTKDTDIYFVANRLEQWQDADCSFRVAERQPELWYPVTGEVRDAGAFRQDTGRTIVPLRLPPNGSLFVVFRREIPAAAQGQAQFNEPRPNTVQELAGPWEVKFDLDKRGPANAVQFDKLVSWPTRPETEIQYYSGPAVYRTTFDLPKGEQAAEHRRWWIDLGLVKNVAVVTLNGKNLGVVWTDPPRLEMTGNLLPTGNELAIEVTNLWPNRLIGDRHLPQDERRTKTNIRKFTDESPLLESGLLGPVQLMQAEK